MKNRILSISLAAMLALSIGLVGCGGEEIREYSLTISSTEGGSVTSPEEPGPYTYDAGQVVNLVAKADDGYEFVSWTGDVSEIADVEDSTTLIKMNDNYSITATFALKVLEIRTWYDLDAVREDLEANYIVMNDLDSATLGYAELASPTANQGKGWQPIGMLDNRFEGNLNGQGYEIRDLFVNRPEEDYVALFREIGQEAVIADIGLVNTIVIGNWTVSSLVGYSSGIVSYSYSTGTITGVGWIVGGLVGENWGSVEDSHSGCTVTGQEVIGGVVGISHGTIQNCYFTGDVTGNWTIGGLVGENGDTVTNCYSTGRVIGGELVGGLLGINMGTVCKSYSSSMVTGGWTHGWTAGGLVGNNTGTVSDCYATGSTNGERNIGGLVGSNSGTLNTSYATGTVAGEYSVGGLVGLDDEATVTNSFWDIQTSGFPTSAGGTGKTTAEMKTIATFSGADWNIVGVANAGSCSLSCIWNIVDGQTYPFLSWQFVS